PKVFPCCSWLGSLLDQGIRCPGVGRGHIAGHGEDLAALLCSATGGNARTARLACFHHQHAQGKPADDAVANRKILWRSKRFQRKFTNQCAAKFQKAVSNSLVLTWVNGINSGTENSNCFAFSVDSAAMPSGIYPARQAAEDDQTA